MYWVHGHAHRGQMGKWLTLHNYRPGQFFKTSNGENSPNSFRDIFRPWTHPWGRMGKWPWRCTTTGLDNSTELRNEKIPATNGFRDMLFHKSGRYWQHIGKVIGLWTNSHGVNGQMTLHNDRCRHIHLASNGENPSRGFRVYLPQRLEQPLTRLPTCHKRYDNTPPAGEDEG